MKLKKINPFLILACIAVVLGVGVYAVNSGALATFGVQPFSTIQSGVVQGATPAQPAGVQGANYQPVLTSTLVDAVTGAPISTAYDVQYDITNLQGAKRIVTAGSGTNVNVDIGEAYVATVKPSSTYYAASFSGKIANPTTVLSMALKRENTGNLWINNDPVNGTTRNAIVATPDTATAGGTLNPTVYLQGVTVNRIIGDKALAFSVDYNATQYKNVSFGQVTCPNGTVVTPVAYQTATSNALATGSTTNKTVKIDCEVQSSQSIAVPVNIELQAAFTGADQNATFKVLDFATFTNTQTGLFEYGTANDAGADTNSATNPTAVMYYTN